MLMPITAELFADSAADMLAEILFDAEFCCVRPLIRKMADGFSFFRLHASSAKLVVA
jgi:hypothetical protein